MGYTTDRRLDEGGILNSLAAQVAGGGLPIHKVPERLMELYPGGSPSFYTAHAAEAVRRGIESRYGIRLQVLRSTSYDEPHAEIENNRLRPFVSQYIGGDAISIVGPFPLDIEIFNHNNGKGNMAYQSDIMLPLRTCREGVIDGVSRGLALVKKLGDYGQSGKIQSKIEGVSRVTRSPTIKFNAQDDAEKAMRIISGESVRSHLREIGEEMMGKYGGEFYDFELEMKPFNSHYEVSCNIIFSMKGDYMGHEALTKSSQTLLDTVIFPRLDAEGLEYARLWLAGGRDGDMKPGKENRRGREVNAGVFLPAEYLAAVFKNERGQSPTPQQFQDFSRSKHYVWTGYSQSKTGMEPEILDAVFKAFNPPSPCILSAIMDVEVTAEGNEGAMYSVRTRNFECGREGIRTPLRDELESIIGINGESHNGLYTIKFASTTMAACLCGGLNQHRLGWTGKLAKTKK